MHEQTTQRKKKSKRGSEYGPDHRAMMAGAELVWRRLGSQEREALISAQLEPHVDRPHGFDREVLHSWPERVYVSMHKKGLFSEAAWPCLVTVPGLLVREAGLAARAEGQR